jgi:hypothetical protein
MRTTFTVVALVLTLAVTAETAAAQDPDSRLQPITVQELVLRDGSRLYGSVESETASEVVFRTHAGATVTVRRDDIASLRRISGSVVKGEFLPPDPNATRLFFAPTGRSLRKGQTYLGVYELTMPFVQVGLTDRISIGGGTPLFFGFDESERPFWFTPKVQLLNTERTQVAAGVMHAFNVDGEGAGIGYAVVTRGTVHSSFTAGAGLGYAMDGGTAAVLMFGAEGQVRRNMKVITENYGWKQGGVLSAGIRFFGERLSADLGVAVPLGADFTFVFPVVNFVYQF